MSERYRSSYRNFADIPRNKEQDMQNTIFPAEVQKFNHSRGLGFLYVTIPQGTKLTFDVNTDEHNRFLSDRDGNNTESFEAGEVLPRPLDVLVFLHSRILEDAGFTQGPSPGDQLEIRFKLGDKGLTTTWVKGDKNTRASDNEPRPLNNQLKWVTGVVTYVNNTRNFSFAKTKYDCQTGEELDFSEVEEGSDKEPTNEVDVYINHRMTKGAGYDTLEIGQEIKFKYWRFESGKASAVLIHRRPEDREDEAA